MVETDIIIGRKKFREKGDIAKEINKIDVLIEHLNNKKKEIERTLDCMNDLREIYFMEYVK